MRSFDIDFSELRPISTHGKRSADRIGSNQNKVLHMLIVSSLHNRKAKKKLKCFQLFFCSAVRLAFLTNNKLQKKSRDINKPTGLLKSKMTQQQTAEQHATMEDENAAQMLNYAWKFQQLGRFHKSMAM